MGPEKRAEAGAPSEKPLASLDCGPATVVTAQPTGEGVAERDGVVVAEGVGKAVGLREREGVGEGVMEGVRPRESVLVGVGVVVGVTEAEAVEVVEGVDVGEGGCRKRTRPRIPGRETLPSEKKERVIELEEEVQALGAGMPPDPENRVGEAVEGPLKTLRKS